MIFDSIVFLFRFLPAFIICYFLAPGVMKKIVLLAGSLVFYAWGEPVYCVLLLFTILADYLCGLLMDRFRRMKRVFIVCGAAVNLGILLAFVYGGELMTLAGSLTGAELPAWQFPLPLGLPFYTLRTLSYLINVYRGEVKSCRNLLDYGVYISMFPYLIGGPVTDYRDMQEQLASPKVTIANISEGLKRLCFGLGKKVLLADRLGELWMEISHAELTGISTASAWLGMIAFALQMYFTFSGFSDMAIGLAKIIGFTLPENFNYPYISASVSEFFSKWFISLTDWLKNYFYTPLAGKKKPLVRRALAILLAGAFMSIWYGTGVTVLVGCIWLAFWFMLEQVLLQDVLQGFVRPVGMLYTALVMMIGLVFVGTETLPETLQYLKLMAGFGKLIDRQAFFLCKEYLFVLVLGASACTPLYSDVATKLKTSGTGRGIALYRLGEKVIPPVILLLAIAGIAGGTYHPFLFFGL